MSKRGVDKGIADELIIFVGYRYLGMYIGIDLLVCRPFPTGYRIEHCRGITGA